MDTVNEILSYLRELNTVSIILRFLLACICGGIIGMERGKKSQAAGLRTHLLVCIGAATAMIVNQYIVVYLNPTADPARLGAQVISGIGFLGAGTIMITGRHQVKGLTTAAGLWASACMGLAVGIGYFSCAGIVCILLYIILKVLNNLDEKYVKNSAIVQVYIEYEYNFVLSQILLPLKDSGWHLVSLEYIGHSGVNGTAMQMVLKKIGHGQKVNREQAVSTLRETEGVRFVVEM